MSCVNCHQKQNHPPYIAARLKKPAYGMNDAPRRWWNILDKALRSCGMVPTRADRCCYVLYSLQSRKQAWEHWIEGAIAQQNGTKDAFTESRERSEMEAAFAKTLDPTAGSPAARKSVAGIINLFVDDLFGTGGNKMEQRVLTRRRKDFHLGSEDWNDVAFTGQRIRWTQDSQNGPYIEVSQDKAIDEVEGHPNETKHEGRPRLHSFDAYNVQKPSGTDKLAAEKDTVPMLLFMFKMRFDGSFSNNWRCEVSQQTGETNQITASETSVLATHRTIENTWIS